MAIVTQGAEAFKTIRRVQRSGLQAKHCESLIQGAGQTLLAQIVGADKSVPTVEEHANPCSFGERWIHAGDPILLGKQTNMVRSFQKNLYQIGSS